MASEGPKRGPTSAHGDARHRRAAGGVGATRRRWLRRFRPELVKVVSLIELKRLRADEFLASPGFDETAPGSQSARVMVRRVNEGTHWRNHLSEAHQLNHELNQVLPLIATDEYVYASLEYELNRRKDPEHVVLITDLFDKTRIKALLVRHWD